MKKILNFGSLNIDKVFAVKDIVKPGQTIAAAKYDIFVGGKGLNQSVALARAGSNVWHAGKVGGDGEMLLQFLQSAGVDTSYVDKTGTFSGNAIIQVAKSGQNSIILYGGSNKELTIAQIQSTIAHFSSGDMLVLQNETNFVSGIIAQAHKAGMNIAFNPSPYDDSIKECGLDKVTYLILNEIEGEEITGESQPQEIIRKLQGRYPQMKIVLTLGKQGSIYADSDSFISMGIHDAPVVDTTAAGDTFLGYFISGITEHGYPNIALQYATVASGIAVSRMGAAPSIPEIAEVKAALGS